MAPGGGSSHHGALFPTKFAQLKTARTGVRSTLQTLGADTDERELRALAGHDEDAKAILKLCVFVEVRERVIKPELRRSHRERPAAASICARLPTCCAARAKKNWAPS